MNTLRIGLPLAAAVFCAFPAWPAAGQSFSDLNFESTTVPPGQAPGSVSTDEALPGWTAYLGNVQQSEVLYNYTYNTDATVDLLGPGWKEVPNIEPGVIDGNYSVYLQAGYYGMFVSASISENGEVPLTAQSLQFKAWEMFGGGFTVSFNGNDLPLNLLSTGTAPSGQPYDVYGVNIGQYAGQTGLLEFTEPAGADNDLLLDDIRFSPMSVPEPSPLVLTGIAAAMLATRAQWRRTR